MNINNPVQEFHVKDYIDILYRKREIITIFFITVVLVVTLGSFMVRPVYRATVTLLIDPESPNVLTSTGMVSLQSPDYMAYKEYYQSQIEIITSQGLAKKVFDDFNLGSMPEYKKAKEPIKKFLKTIKIEPVRDTRLLKLHVDNNNAELATKIANRMAELYIKRNLYYISKNELSNLLKNEYLKMQARLSEYSNVYKEGHPEMIKLRKEIREMADRIDEEKKSVYNYSLIEDYMKSDARIPLAGFKANNISIQDAAEKPVIPIRPKKRLNVLVAIIVGLVGGVGLAFFFEYLDDTVKTLEDIERAATKWPFLGNVPDITGGGAASELKKELFVHLKPKDPIAELYRSIRTRVLFSSTEERPLRAIIITSPGPQEGKTTTLCNFAIAMAQNQKKILLVDADMRKPRLHDVFNKKNDNGLSNFLSAQSQFDDVIQKTGIENLSVVSAGGIPPNPSELLASNKIKEFIQKAKEKFDFVLFDTPPIGMLTDAAVLSAVADGTIMIVESGKTSKRVLGRLYQVLEHAKAKIIGMVLNRISLTPSNYYYYSYYYEKPKINLP